MPLIVSVCGAPGSGKSALIGSAVAALGDADSLHAFEEYSHISDFPSDIPRWLAAGANPNEWRSDKLVKDLAQLHSGRDVTLPAGNRVVKAARTVLIEDFFGRKRTALAPFLTSVVYVNVPLEIALARRLLRDINRGPFKDDSQKARDYVASFCGRYLGELRELYVIANRYAAEDADLILDGMKPTDLLTREFLQFLSR
jgi:uridine kinase